MRREHQKPVQGVLERQEAELREWKRREAEQRKYRDGERERLEQDYLKANEAAQYATTAAEHSEVAELFRALGNYRDSESRYVSHVAIAQEKHAKEKRKLEDDEKAKEQEELRKLTLLPTLTITVASATNAALSFISGGILLLILSALFSGAATLSLCGLLELWTLVEKVSSGGETDILSQADQFGKLSAGYAVPLAIVAFVTRSPAWACIAASQLTGGLSCMRDVGNDKSQTQKVILACVSLVSLACAFGFLSMG